MIEQIIALNSIACEIHITFYSSNFPADCEPIYNKNPVFYNFYKIC